MNLELYAIKDRLTEYAAPIPFINEVNAIRYFTHEMNKEGILKENPEDFTLWKLAEYDTETGEIKGITPELKERGVNLIWQKKDTSELQ